MVIVIVVVGILGIISGLIFSLHQKTAQHQTNFWGKIFMLETGLSMWLIRSGINLMRLNRMSMKILQRIVSNSGSKLIRFIFYQGVNYVRQN
jgi:hypothetical protein